MRALILIAALAFAAPAAAAQTSQLALSVQFQLNALGFEEVDASSLTLRQLAAIHTQVDASWPLGGLRALRQRGTVRNILRIDGYRTDDGDVVQGARADAPPR
jgi:hypothetical protein